MEGRAPDFTFKIVLLGETAVGKSATVLRFVRDEFSEFQESTIGAAFFSSQIEVESDAVKLEIWDTAGQERYQSLAGMYYRGAKGGVVVYDITNVDSFNRAKAWVRELRQNGTMHMAIALAGNKSDLEHMRQVPREMAKAYADEQGLIFMETSARTGENINALFHALAARLPRERRADPAPSAGATRLEDLDRSGRSGGGGDVGGCC